MANPNNTPALVESFNSITGVEKATQKNKWMCRQEMYNKFGKEEAEEMIDNNLVDERLNPQNLKRKQWKVREDAVTKKVEKKKELKAGTKTEVEGEAAGQVMQAIQDFSVGSGV